MGKVSQFVPKDKLDKEQLKKVLSEFIDRGDCIIIVSHHDHENITDLSTNLNFNKDRVGLKGLILEAQEILTLVSPVNVIGEE